MVEARETRYRDDHTVYAGVAAENLVVPSANPRNYHQAITDPAGCEPIDIDAKLFVPAGDGPRPTVMVVPGSLGVGPNHEAHAEQLVAEGFVVCVVDPFGPRAVTSTVANQTAYSFAASAFDVLATLQVLRDRPEVDADRIAAQGHSRGGSAVTIAACRPFADAVVGPDAGLAAAFAVYPWCGHQFERPDLGRTRFRAIIGDLDEWCSVQQVQAQVHAMQLAGGDASLRVVGGAHHSFDRLEPVQVIDDASVAPAAPTRMLCDDGAMIDPRTGQPDASLTDLDGFIAAIESGHGRQGAAIGGVDDQPEVFRSEMLAFHDQLNG
ncbi:MAG: prolyl oligopeptidase family serine peptidase [Acidimicrobiales bacterium]|nr:prolyl oligopeptidase family serine peptidase [Acidimicrobiales bacterium]